ncbi:Integrase family protein (fragment) [Desulfamplus magnetovallimortis]|uniref:Integrase family protein n=2 Tax=Desulfamplus magnetovallimortis TaxID=1246637 RepID=A0A1W1HDN7_9BACT
MVKKFLMKKVTSGLSASTVTHMKCCVAGVLNVAMDDEVLKVNPAHRLGKIFKTRQVKDDIEPYSKDELVQLMEAFQEFFPEHYPMALTLARTGMRIGEVVALQWKDIDFKKRHIHIQRTFSRDKLGTPKNGKDRYVDMSNQLAKVLAQLKEVRKAEAEENGWKRKPKWIFINKVGNTIDINHWRKRVFYKVIEKSGLKKIRIHDLRHTYASLLIQAGESLTYIRDQLGHHSISFTVDIYGHLTPGGNKAAVDGLDDEEM